ncbi:MAG TPA: restriction endonuclease [Chthoniobacterales bacterium]|nr:restriction endonuclease [Chthoniobacterales bacterium]
MARTKKNEEALGILALIVGAPILFANWLHDKIGIPQPVTYVSLGLILVVGLWLYFAERNKRFRAIRIANIDSMTGIEFEAYLKKLLSSQGYSVTIIGGSGDLGVDLIASRGAERIAIQVKRYNSRISRRAISDAVAGMQHYRCNRAMVITNSHFTPGALMLARSTNCSLVDRDVLARWIVELQAAEARAT